MTGDVDSDYLYFTYKGADGKVWRQWKDTDENTGDDWDNYDRATNRWIDGSVKTVCERTKWQREGEGKRKRWVACGFKC